MQESCPDQTLGSGLFQYIFDVVQGEIAYELRKSHCGITGTAGTYSRRTCEPPFILQEPALSHYEKNRRKPDFEVLTRLADIFDVSIDYLIGRTKQSDVVMDEDVRDFVDTLELSDKEVLERFDLMIDGKSLTEEEARRFIAFVRMERSMD